MKTYTNKELAERLLALGCSVNCRYWIPDTEQKLKIILFFSENGQGHGKVGIWKGPALNYWSDLPLAERQSLSAILASASSPLTPSASI